MGLLLNHNRDNRENTAQGIGCLLLFMGLIAATFGLAGLIGVAPHLELNFFGLALNDMRGRTYWVLGSLAVALAGFFFFAANDQTDFKPGSCKLLFFVHN